MSAMNDLFRSPHPKRTNLDITWIEAEIHNPIIIPYFTYFFFPRSSPLQLTGQVNDVSEEKYIRAATLHTDVP